MIRVMLVDDEQGALDLLEILLQQIGGITVVGKYLDPFRAIEALNVTPVDAIFLDIQLPGMTGMAAAEDIRRMLPKTVIVFTTAFSEYALEAFDVGSVDYLLKPISRPKLERAVLRVRQAVSAALDMGTAPTNRTLIQCMGGFYIPSLKSDNDSPLSWKTTKEKEICAFLIHHEGKPVDTALIIESIWPGYDLKKAKSYLYTCLSYLRRSLHEHGAPISVSNTVKGFAIALNDGLTADVTSFERMLDKSLSDHRPDWHIYEKMNEMYKGEYMEGCDYSWAMRRQAELTAKYIRALRKWCELFLKEENPGLAADSLQRVLTVAPDSEADGRELIRLYLEMGRRKEALYVYRQLEQAVNAYMGLELEEETVKLYAQMV